MLIELTDGKIKEIYTDTESWRGCETCDWGSEYVNSFEIELTSGTIYFKVGQMYDHALSEDYMIKLFLQNIEEIKEMKEAQFVEWLKDKMKKDIQDTVDDFEIKFVENHQQF